MDKTQEWAIPQGLSEKGRHVAQVIASFIKKKEKERWGREASTGGCRTFYSPQEWAARGEPYGTGSLLIVVYDGGDVKPYFNMDHGWHRVEEMNDELRKVGVFAEPATCWYGSIYEI